MVDLHTHTFFSDGELLPSELIRRAAVLGLTGIALTDHVDTSNVEQVVKGLVKACQTLENNWGITAIPGAEITHVPPSHIKIVTDMIRAFGGKIVVVHGETITEPVAGGTNRAALEAQVDILAHPGLISEEEVILAAKKGVALEISGRKGHSLANGHVAKLALAHQARLVINSDAHQVGDLFDQKMAKKILLSAGIPCSSLEAIFQNSKNLLASANSR